jgi:hypothetical protein
VFQGIYEVPIGKGKPFLSTAPAVVRHILSDWQLNWFTTFQTGAPLGFDGAERVGTSDNNPHTIYQWFDTSQFVPQEPFTLRYLSSRLADLRGPGVKKWDFTVVRHFPITERIDFNLRALFLNAFNTTHFNNPNTNVTSSSFGTITSSSVSREIQIAARVTF